MGFGRACVSALTWRQAPWLGQPCLSGTLRGKKAHLGSARRESRTESRKYCPTDILNHVGTAQVTGRAVVLPPAVPGLWGNGGCRAGARGRRTPGCRGLGASSSAGTAWPSAPAAPPAAGLPIVLRGCPGGCSGRGRERRLAARDETLAARGGRGGCPSGY